MVVGISDSDTIKARSDNQTLSVRLAEIDAPDKFQPFGQRSKQALADLCFGKDVQIERGMTDTDDQWVAPLAPDRTQTSPK